MCVENLTRLNLKSCKYSKQYKTLWESHIVLITLDVWHSTNVRIHLQVGRLSSSRLNVHYINMVFNSFPDDKRK